MFSALQHFAFSQNLVCSRNKVFQQEDYFRNMEISCVLQGEVILNHTCKSSAAFLVTEACI